MRWLALLLTLGLTTAADAQIFKPKGKSGSSAKASNASTKTAKKSPAKASKKKSSTKAKKSSTAARSRSDEASSEVASKESDRDFVKITDDEEIE